MSWKEESNAWMRGFIWFNELMLTGNLRRACLCELSPFTAMPVPCVSVLMKQCSNALMLMLTVWNWCETASVNSDQDPEEPVPPSFHWRFTVVLAVFFLSCDHFFINICPWCEIGHLLMAAAQMGWRSEANYCWLSAQHGPTQGKFTLK